MNFSELLKTVGSAKNVTADSRAAGPGSIFVAVRGTARDGHEFIHQAAAAGVKCIVGEDPAPKGLKVDYVRVPDSRKALARLSAEFFGNPSQSMRMVGVTGTSGKTTTTYLLEAILKEAGHDVGVIGTVNIRRGGKEIPSNLTTPGPVELQEILARMKREGAGAVVMEVSSHALKQSRVGAVHFDAAVFTNLSPEHLDFHPDMEDYFLSKKMLFDECAREASAAGKRPLAAINADDEYGRRLLKEVGGASFGMASGLDYSGSDLKFDSSGIHGTVSGIPIHSELLGSFNALNILGAIAAARGLGITPDAIARGVAALKVVPGRLERVPNSRGLTVLVDYAHKSDALKKVLETIREIRGGGRLLTVFGCGGDRDRQKRPVMGKIAVELSDQVFVTSDNPRTEDPQAIIREILAGTQGHSNFTVEADRRKAIHLAVKAAKSGDFVVIAGKGHEDYQILGTKKVHFDDREVASEALRG